MGSKKLALKARIHPSALISDRATIGAGTRIWAFTQVRERAVIGGGSMLGSSVYIDSGVKVGRRVNIHNRAQLYRNLIVEDDVFIGPGVCFINDPTPRANRIRNLKGKTGRVGKGASIGANTSVLNEIRIGRYAMIGAGSVVTSNVPDFALMRGVPARLRGFVSPDGATLRKTAERNGRVFLTDSKKSFSLTLSKKTYDVLQKTF